MAPNVAATALVGLKFTLREAHESPDCIKRIELIGVARMVKHSISHGELTKTTASTGTAAIMGQHSENPQSRKLLRIVFMSLLQASRKIIQEKFAAVPISAQLTFWQNARKSLHFDEGEHWINLVSLRRNR